VGRPLIFTTSGVILAVLWLAGLGGESQPMAQVLGEEAEMERLHAKAEEAVAGGDADGAAMNMGRAALMAAQLQKRETHPLRQQFLRGSESLFRGQEHAYRALALFRRAGGQLPASSGVCGSLRLAQTSVDQAVKELGSSNPAGEPESSMIQRLAHQRAAAEEWVTVVAAMQTDFQCAE
jgi:hypothetical protein